jgi:endo-1,4-beta-xylanase
VRGLTSAGGAAVLSCVLVSASCGSIRIDRSGDGGASSIELDSFRSEASTPVLAGSRNLWVGSAVNANALQADQAYRDKLAAELTSVTAEDAMKWAVVEPTRGQLDWAQADAIVDFATEHGQRVRGHTLVWHQSLPAWLTSGTFTADELATLLQEHVTTEMGRYVGRVAVWDVVNEAIETDGSLRHGVWLDRLGAGYIADAFRWARAADPAAKLYINDYDVEWRSPKSDALYALVRDLRAQGVPIDGVGFQTHAMMSDQLSQLGRTLRRFSALGVDVAITELDVRVPLPADASKLASQAGVYQRAAAACLAASGCVGITFWGFTDKDSWIPNAFPGWGAADLFDAAFQPKPAYDSFRATLATWQPAPTDPVGWWWLDEPSGGLALDSSGNHPATATAISLGGVGRVPGVPALAGTGVDWDVSTSGPVLRTDASFTVSAWVKLADKAGPRVIASQAGGMLSGFYLMYQSTSDRWEFTAPSTDTAAPTWQTAQSTSVPQTGVWTHVAGVFDASARALRIYVNGASQGSLAGVSTWNAAGPFQIGRSLSGAWFSGALADVRAWNRALPAAEIAAVAQRQVGQWTLDTSTGDFSWFGRDGVQTAAGVSWTADRAAKTGAALSLDGTGSVDRAQPLVFTNASYSVTAWVKLGDKNGYRVVAAQDGSTRDGFYLEYHKDSDRWAFITSSTDSDSGTWQTALSKTVPSVGNWTHLAGVYDSAAQQLRLYVNGAREATAGAPSSWHAGGPFHVGRSISGSQFVGALDDVRLYAVALSDADVTAVYRAP